MDTIVKRFDKVWEHVSDNIIQHCLDVDRRLVLVGEPGMGKSRLMELLHKKLEQSIYVAVHPSLGTHTVSGFLQSLARKTLGKPCRDQSIEECLEAIQDYAAEHDIVFLVDGLSLAEGWGNSQHSPVLKSLGTHAKAILSTRPGEGLEWALQTGYEPIFLDSSVPTFQRYFSEWMSEELADVQASVSDGREILYLAEGNTWVAESLLKAYKTGWKPFRKLPLSLSLGMTQLLEELLAKIPMIDRGSAVQVLGLLAEAPESLKRTDIVDFLEISEFRLAPILKTLAPVISLQEQEVRLFNPVFARVVAEHYQRDLPALHGKVISFFRETYPSWSEMDDWYGWKYLGYHAEAFGRNARRKDYSLLYWLVEGSFLNEKLTRTAWLPSVLDDYRRAYFAALEDSDYVRLSVYTIGLAKLWNDNAAKWTHRCADSGRFGVAFDNAQLIQQENHRWLALLTTGWQAFDEGFEDVLETCALSARKVEGVNIGVIEVPYLAGLVKGVAETGVDSKFLWETLCSVLSRQQQYGVAWRVWGVGQRNPDLLDYLNEAATFINDDSISSFSRNLVLTEVEYQENKEEQPASLEAAIAPLTALKKWPLDLTNEKEVDGFVQELRSQPGSKRIEAFSCFTHYLVYQGDLAKSVWPKLVSFCGRMSAIDEKVESMRSLITCMRLGTQEGRFNADLLESMLKVVHGLGEIASRLSLTTDLIAWMQQLGYQDFAESEFSKLIRIVMADSENQDVWLLTIAGFLSSGTNYSRARDLVYTSIEKSSEQLGRYSTLRVRNSLAHLLWYKMGFEPEEQNVLTQDSVLNQKLDAKGRSSMKFGELAYCYQTDDYEKAEELKAILKEEVKESGSFVALSSCLPMLQQLYVHKYDKALLLVVDTLCGLIPEFLEQHPLVFSVLDSYRYATYQRMGLLIEAEGYEKSVQKILSENDYSDLPSDFGYWLQCLEPEFFDDDVWLHFIPKVTKILLSMEPGVEFEEKMDAYFKLVTYTASTEQLGRLVSQVKSDTQLQSARGHLVVRFLEEHPQQVLMLLETITISWIRRKVLLECLDVVTEEKRPSRRWWVQEMLGRIGVYGMGDSLVSDSLAEAWLGQLTSLQELQEVAKRFGWHDLIENRTGRVITP